MGRVEEDQSLLRSSHDPSRPAVTASQAAEVLQQSRFHVAELVKKGALPGYGIPATKRTRWYVYVDALPSSDRHDDSADHSQAPPSPRTSSEPDLTILGTLRAVRDQLGSVEKQRRDSRNVLLDAYDAASYDNNQTVQELLRSINDSERRNFKLDNDISAVREVVITLLDQLQGEGADR